MSTPVADQPTDAAPAAPDGAATADRGAITVRSVAVGTAAVVAICGLTPYNDFVLSDTSLSAGFLPLGLVLLQFLLIVGVNGPLHRWAPRHALTTPELAVVSMMMLLASALPNWGLMRFLVPTPVAYFFLGSYEAQFWQAFSSLDLPAWLFPVELGADGRASPVVTWFFNSVPDGQHIPWAAWAKPAVAWGVFVAAMLATLVAMARLVIAQWLSNERLPFPLVQVQAALIEAPPPGRALNALFRSRLLWAGLIAVFLIHGLSILDTYFPRHFERIPLGYDLTGLLGTGQTPGQPLSYVDSKLKKATLSFIVVGVTFFIRSRVAFSLWGIFLLTSVVSVQQAAMGREMPSAAWGDQHLGACAAFALGIFWIGRHHWARVLRNAFGVSGDGADRGAFWIAAGGIAVMVGWLLVVGVQAWVAGMVVGFILLAHLVVARVVAETGLPFYRSSLAASQVMTNLAPAAFSGRDVFFANVFTVLGPVTSRDSVATFATTGLGTCRQAGIDEGRRARLGLGAVIAWTLVVGCVVSAVATLYCHYSYPTPMVRETVPAGNNFGAVYIPKRDVGDPLVSFSQGRFAPKQHDSATHMAIGFVVMVGLEAASLRWSAWPLLPVGYVTSYGAFIGNAWFSVFVGWIAKVLIVRFGGASLFQRARPLFVGIIFGEALAAGGWLVVNAIVVLGGGESQAVRFLP